MDPRQTPNCRICGAELTPLEQRSGGVCGSWRCREEVLARGASEERRRAAHRVRQRGAEGDVDWKSAPVVIVPWRPSELGPLPVARQRAFLAHLDTLLVEPESVPTGPGDETASTVPTAEERETHTSTAGLDAPPDPLLARVCGACKGACCYAGGTHAFLDRGRIRTIADRMGGPEEVRRVYEARLPERTVRGSCVFHTEQGCHLPRELRGDLCNRYECRGLESARMERQKGARVVHVVRREDQLIHDSAFAAEDRIERVRRVSRPGRRDR